MLNHDFGRQLQSFFETYLREQRALSPNTVKSYRDTFKLLVAYLALVRRGGERLRVEDLDAKTVLAFLRHLEDSRQGRGNSAPTRNQRLAAIQCFFRYVALYAPPRLERHARRVLAIPKKRVNPQPAESLDRKELEALLAQPSTATPDGVRDLAILAFLYNTGARAQEAADARLGWFDFPNRTVMITGKGGRRRTTPLWPSTVRLLMDYKTRYRRQPREGGDRFFVNQRGGAFTRFGIWAIAKRHIRSAAKSCPSLAGRRISTHSLRHTTAVHLLEAGVEVNVIKSWLGHASISATSRYLDTNLSHKRRVLEQFGPPGYVASSTEAAPHSSARELLGWLEDL